MLFLSTDGRFSHLSEYICEDHVSFVLMAVVYYFLFCQMSVYFKGIRGVMKGTWWRTTKSEQNQGEAWKILRLLDLQVRVHDMHLATTLLLSNPLPHPPPPQKKGELYDFKSAIDTLLRVPISSPRAVLLPRQVDLEFKGSRDSWFWR